MPPLYMLHSTRHNGPHNIRLGEAKIAGMLDSKVRAYLSHSRLYTKVILHRGFRRMAQASKNRLEKTGSHSSNSRLCHSYFRYLVSWQLLAIAVLLYWRLWCPWSVSRELGHGPEETLKNPSQRISTSSPSGAE